MRSLLRDLEVIAIGSVVVATYVFAVVSLIRAVA